jgi:hypothetical protein
MIFNIPNLLHMKLFIEKLKENDLKIELFYKKLIYS